MIVHAGNKSNVCLPICLSAYLAVCLFVCLSVSLSVSLFFSHSLSIDIYDFFPTARAAFIGSGLMKRHRFFEKMCLEENQVGKRIICDVIKNLGKIVRFCFSALYSPS